MSAHRSTPTPWLLSPSERLQIVIALACALSGTLTGSAWGPAMAAVVLAVVVARREARRSLERSAAVRRGVLAPAQQTRLLHPAGHHRQAVARP